MLKYINIEIFKWRKVSMLKAKSTGFTLIELVIVSSIIVLISSVTLFNFPNFRERISIEREAGKMSAAIRRVQSYALAVREFSPGSGQFPGYGAYIDIADSQSYEIFGDIVDIDPLNEKNVYNPPVEDVETVYVEGGVKIFQICGDGDCSLDNIHIFYLRPTPTVFLTSCNATCISYNTVDIVLTSSGGSIQKMITILSTGQISVQ